MLKRRWDLSSHAPANISKELLAGKDSILDTEQYNKNRAAKKKKKGKN